MCGKSKRLISYLLVFALVFSAFFSISENRARAAVAVTGISLAITEFEMTLPSNPKDTLTWPNNYWTISPADATNQNVTVKSSNTNVVTAKRVSSDSNRIYVEAVGAGTSTVTVTTEDGGYSASCKITVKGPKVSSLEWISYPGRSGGMPYIQVGTTHSTKVSVKVQPSNADDQRVKYTSKPEGILSIDSNGNVTALKVGEACIVATAMDGSGVSIESNKITTWGEEQTVLTDALSWKKTTSTLEAGKTFKFEVTFSPTNVTDQSLKWSSTSPAYATVSKDGTVTAITPGKTTITATAQDGSGKKVSQALTVLAATPPEPTSVSISEKKIDLVSGKTKQLTATVKPDGADQSVVWSSSDESVAKVSSAGIITAVGSGNATITAVSKAKGSVSSSCKVTVKTPVTGIQWVKKTDTLVIDSSAQFEASVLPEKADNKGVKYSSSNPQVATVNANGYVIGVAEGSAVITAFSAEDNSIKVTQQVTVSLVGDGKTDIGLATISIPKATRTYNGSSYKPKLTITINSAVLSEGTDFTVKYENNKNAGVAKAIATGCGDHYKGEASIEFTIAKKGLSLSGLKFVDKYYNGSKYMNLESRYPTVEGILDADSGKVTVMTKRPDYVITGTCSPGQKSRRFTVGLFSITGTAASNYKIASGTTATGTIKKIPLSKVTLKADSVKYNGTAQKPVVTAVTGANGGKLLLKYCTISYTRNKAETKDFTSAGTIVVTVTGTGNYKGSVTKTYKIVK